MEFKYWKHKYRREVIDQASYDTLPLRLKANYVPTNDTPTHQVKEAGEDNFVSTVIPAAATLLDIFKK